MNYDDKNDDFSKGDKNRIELKVNGRIFPLWVVKNFKKYTLPDIIRGKDEDPCQEKISFESDYHDIYNPKLSLSFLVKKDNSILENKPNQDFLD